MTINQKNSLGYLTNMIARQFAQLIGQELAPLGLNPAYLPVLFELWDGQELTQQELTEKSSVSQATMANTLGRMERDGLIERLPNPNDARSRLIRLTSAALAKKDDCVAAAQKINNGVLEALDEQEIKAWLDIMNKVVQRQKQMLG
ncbi:MarR family winged helix-turn-helix transcriptional regulator [Moraxella nasicaprae]|uniref:MarR family transcriptional regulator n=1 Tax=Moraxella nasicaprae TaxID=2904122 RepID=A0ABY6F5M7_9GAMM|nr:MarR family transcriptional regulator [Moraxella nasicaprae]UXZ05383.1 MarR family transcriptional regulator [Moraxella nasicaprae]